MTEDSTGPTNSSAEGLGTYLPGTASLVQEIDSEWQLYMNIIIYQYCTERILVVLRDGKTLIGYLRSVDQFGKTHTIHTHTYPCKYPLLQDAPTHTLTPTPLTQLTSCCKTHTHTHTLTPTPLTQLTSCCKTQWSVSMLDSSMETSLEGYIWCGARMSPSVER